MLSVSEALAAVLQQATCLPAEQVGLNSLPLGRILGSGVSSDIDSPPYTKALMDGYAVRAADAAQSPVTLRIVEEVAAGRVPTKFVQAGEATRIMTGAPIPNGADSVVMIERTELLASGQVKLLAPVRAGQNILERGTEMKAGEMVLHPGSELGPQEFGLLAAVGHTSITVYPKPRVAVLTTGDEIVEPAQKPGPGQIRNSNGSMLLAQALRGGGVPIYLGIARDNVESLRSLIQKGLNEADVLILSGGVSAGKFDLVPGVLQELGVVSHFHKIAMKPGKPLFFGARERKLVFGLPGNPVSSFVGFELFVRPALRKLRGHAEAGPRTTRLPISADFRTQNDRPTYWPARLEHGENGDRVRALPWLGSADLRGLHTADALLAIPPGEQVYLASQLVPVLPLDS